MLNIPLYGDSARGKGCNDVGLPCAASGLGRMTGALAGGPVWLAGGLPATGIVLSFITCVALASFVWGERKRISIKGDGLNGV